MGIAPDYVPKGQPPKYINQSVDGLNDLQTCQKTLDVVALVMLITNMFCTLTYAVLLFSNTLAKIDSLAVWLLVALNLIAGSVRVYIYYQSQKRLYWFTKIAIIVWIFWFGQASWNLAVQHITLH